jgi:hypothetical protein
MMVLPMGYPGEAGTKGFNALERLGGQDRAKKEITSHSST